MTTKFILASGAIGAMLMAAPVAALAHEGDTANKGDNGLHLGAFIQANFGIDKDKLEADREALKADTEGLRTHVVMGTVTSVNGGTITIDPAGKKATTTTITTNSNTVFKTRGGATTSAAITVGTKIVAFGTTTATSTSGDSFSASLVALIGKGFGHLRAWFHFGH